MSLSTAQHATLLALAETVLPAGKYIPGADETTVGKMERFLETLPSAIGMGLSALLRGLDGASLLHERCLFRNASPDARLAILERWRHGDPMRRLVLRALASPLKIAHFDDPALYKKLGCVYDMKSRPEPKPAYMRERVHAIDEDTAVECDVVVIGTGAGGAVVGRELAEAGLAVVFIEEGKYFERHDFNGRPFEMQQKLYRRGGSTFSVGNVAIPIPLGQTVGGSTTVNSGTCYRTPDRVLAEWAHDFGLDELAPDRMGRYFDRVEAVLGVEHAKPELLGGNGRVVARGCDAIGLKKHGPLRRNAPACDGQGVCVFGCPTDAKRSTNVSYIPLALRAGAELFPGAKVVRIIVDGGRARGVVARAGAHTLTVRARAVVVACGSIMTPLLLDQNGLGRSSDQLGKNLSIHPAAGVLAEFDEQVLPWTGIPQGYGIEDLHDEGILFEGAHLPLEFTMSMTQLIGPTLVRLAESYDKVASFGFMVEDTSRGSVRAIGGQPVISYWLQDRDVSHIKRAVDTLAQVFFAAGARRVHAPVNGFDILQGPEDLAAFRRATIKPWDLDLSAYHPLGTARMGRDPKASVVDADHQVHDCEQLFVVDGAAVPSAVGVNPQITIMAMATRAAERIASKF